jgi:type IV pilus assembly protein PilM
MGQIGQHFPMRRLTPPFLSRAAAPLLGLDVGASALRLVELSRPRTGPLVLERAHSKALEPGCLIDGRIERFDELVDALRQLVHSSGSRTAEVAMALPVSAVISRSVFLPSGLSDRERLLQVQAEAAQFIPFPLDEVSLDFTETGQGGASADEVEVLIVAARQDAVSDLQGLAEAAGLKAVLIDVASHASRRAAWRVVEAAGASVAAPLIALFEVGAQTLGLQVLRQEAVLFERQQPLVEEPLSSCVDALAQDMARALQFFFTSTPYNQVDQILLGGGCAAGPGLPEAVSRHTGTACQVINPFEGMVAGAGLSMLPSLPQAPAYLRATGLALRRFCR